MKIVQPVVGVKKCVVCGDPLEHFAGYIPKFGEVCMKCYRDYVRKNGE